MLTLEDDRLPDHSILGEPGLLSTISYEKLLKDYLGVSEPELFTLFRDMGNSYMGGGIDTVPALFALGLGAPGLKATSLGSFSGLIRGAIQWATEPYIYHFPDGNASVARMLVRRLRDWPI